MLIDSSPRLDALRETAADTDTGHSRSNPLSEQRMEELAVRLNRTDRECPLNQARAIGKLLVDHLYGGDLALWRNHGEREVSFRKFVVFACNGKLTMKRTSLQRAVALVELEARLGGPTWGHLSLSHIRLVFGVADAEQRELLTAAEAEGWTVLRMDTETKSLRDAKQARRGRRPEPERVKTVRRLEKVFKGVEVDFAGLDDAASWRADERARVLAALTGLENACAAARVKIGPESQGRPT